MKQNFSISEEFSFLEDNYKRVTDDIAEAAIKSGRHPEEVTLMAVTKTVSPLMINKMLSFGVGLIGENKVQELLSKLEYLEPADVEKHIIGHLQTNKVRKIIDAVSMIQSVDSESLIAEISRQAVKNNKTMDILLEVNIGREDAKTGLMPEMLTDIAFVAKETPGVCLKGLMCVPPICEDEITARKYFEQTRVLFEDLRKQLGNEQDFSVLSMGMSSDYSYAILEGATLVRVGSSLFGNRRY